MKLKLMGVGGATFIEEEFPRKIKRVHCLTCGTDINHASMVIDIDSPLERFSVSWRGVPSNCCEDPSWSFSFRDSDIQIDVAR